MFEKQNRSSILREFPHWFTLMNLFKLTPELMNLRDETGSVRSAERTHRFSVLGVLKQDHKHGVNSVTDQGT